MLRVRLLAASLRRHTRRSHFLGVHRGQPGGIHPCRETASVLSMAGIGVGSTALVTFVAAIGGPVTLAVGLASILALGAWSLTGEDWRSRLAKKIAKTLQEKGFVSNIREKSDAFWDSTWSAFEKGADAIEEKFAEYITKNEELLKGNSKEKIQAAIDSLEDLRDFLAESLEGTRMITGLPVPLTSVAREHIRHSI